MHIASSLRASLAHYKDIMDHRDVFGLRYTLGRVRKHPAIQAVAHCKQPES